MAPEAPRDGRIVDDASLAAEAEAEAEADFAAPLAVERTTVDTEDDKWDTNLGKVMRAETTCEASAENRPAVGQSTHKYPVA